LHRIQRLRMCYKNTLIFQWFLCFMWSDNVFDSCLFACLSKYLLVFLLQIPTLEFILSPFALPKSPVFMLWNFHGNSTYRAKFSRAINRANIELSVSLFTDCLWLHQHPGEWVTRLIVIEYFTAIILII
jgi:hypothetical protein